MTPKDFQSTLDAVVSAADMVLPIIGQPELVPIVGAASLLIQKIAEAAQKQGASDESVAVVMNAARVAADAAEALKFPYD